MNSVQKPQTIKAAFWMFGAVLAFSSMAVSGREISTELDTFELMLYRSIISIGGVVALGGMMGTLGQINTQHMGLHLIRNVSHFAGQNLWFAAINLIPLAQVFAVEFTSPIWVLLIAPFVVGERLTRFKLGVAALGFVGVIIVARPDFGNVEPGVILAALSAIGFAGSILVTKRLTAHVSVTCILFWLAVLQAIFGLILAGWDGQITVPSAAVIPWVILVSIGGLSAHLCLTTALSLAPATLVVPFDFARLPVIAIIGAAFYQEAIDHWVFVGAALIFTANYLNLAKEARRPS